MSEKTKKLGPPPKRPHLMTGNPRDPYCARCHKPVSQLGKECQSGDMLG